jgi:hypothetical protein
MWACKTKEKMLVCTQKAVRILQSNWGQYSRERLFDETKYPNEEVIARVIISAGGNCTDIRKVRTCPSKRWWLYLLY